MLNNIIRGKTVEWLQSPDCSVKELLHYIREKGELRNTQIKAIETYLFLKIEGQNKALWKLFSEGFFVTDTDLSKLNINQDARDYLQKNQAASSLFDFARQVVDGSKQLPSLEKEIIESPDSLNYNEIIKKLFYDVNYSDYLISLPMGSGKTYLMAAFIYLDLYFAANESENENFAHNFLVLIPSGLKTSIGPSLRTIEDFDPSWVIPEPSASALKKLIKFDVLDEAKSAKKSNKARNPNAQKVNAILPNSFGQVFIVNAEKVILNRVDTTGQISLFEDDEDKRANELRALIGQIPNLSILIDEVHHAASSDVKLRQVVNRWSEKGSITTVLGFSGTPYLTTAEKIKLTANDTLKISKITNTVYYYPLTRAIEDFLKKPTVTIGENLTPLQIVKEGVEDFNNQYGQLTYENGTIAKVAIYCSDIATLEEEIYPFLQSDLNIHPDEILRFHGGNKTYSLPKENELEFKSLDTPLSRKKYILLVAIGKEGWDCKSLTSVILPQKSKSSSKNAIVQTTCRCLRQVVAGNEETALIWLNQENASILNKALEKEQNTSIEELNSLAKNTTSNFVERHARIDFLKLPKIDFYQLKVTYQSLEEAKYANTKDKLTLLLDNISKYKSNVSIIVKGLDFLDEGERSYLQSDPVQVANYNHWINNISKASFNTISTHDLHKFDKNLRLIFDVITTMEDSQLYFDESYDRYNIESQIRTAFSIRRELTTDKEVIPKKASLLLIDKLKPIAKHNNLYPNEDVIEQILEFDNNPTAIDDFDKKKADRITQLTKDGRFDEVAKVADETINRLTKQKDKSFHILPYNLDSKFETQLLKQIMGLREFRDRQLEIYFNGERGITEFVIDCYAKKGKRWNKVGKYTTDFLIIKRDNKNSIYKALIIEAKGEGFSNDENFIKRKDFIETEFLAFNEDKFRYKKFDFLYLEDSESLEDNISKVNEHITHFFKD
uniref:DEAD/DEAH box helicase family protein n=1 Tax=Psychrobacter sp. T6-1 TaxID=3457447 RepID=UPI003FD5F98D